MHKITRTAGLTLATMGMMGAMASSAFAWGGNATVDSISCPEVHVTLNSANKTESSKWGWSVVQDYGVAGKANVLSTGTFSQYTAKDIKYVIGNVYTTDNAEHTLTVFVGNANNMSDLGDSEMVRVVNCAAPPVGQGPKGDAGPTGPMGPAGPAGPQGIPGLPGQPGQAGPQGEEGPKGDTGATGTQGVPGENGKDGVDGKDGIDGVDGKDGVNGVDGKDGLNGIDGKDGLNGINGKDGLNGINGKDGVNGKDGAPGTTTIVYMTAPGQTQTVSAGAVAGVTATNQVSHRVAKLRIVALKGHAIRHLRVDFEGRGAQVKRAGNGTWVATINMRGLKRGTYAAHVTARVNGRTVRYVHLYRAIYGNPKGGAKTGPNASPIVRL